MTTHDTMRSDRESTVPDPDVPGIVQDDGMFGRRARVDGTGLDVWEVIMMLGDSRGDIDRFLDMYPHVTREQVETGMAYYRLHPDEIDTILEENNSITPESLYAEYPFMRPRPR